MNNTVIHFPEHPVMTSEGEALPSDDYVKEYVQKMRMEARIDARLRLDYAVKGTHRCRKEYAEWKTEKLLGKKYFVDIAVFDLDIKTHPDYSITYMRVFNRLVKLNEGLPARNS